MDCTHTTHCTRNPRAAARGRLAGRDWPAGAQATPAPGVTRTSPLEQTATDARDPRCAMCGRADERVAYPAARFACGRAPRRRPGLLLRELGLRRAVGRVRAGPDRWADRTRRFERRRRELHGGRGTRRCGRPRVATRISTRSARCSRPAVRASSRTSGTRASRSAWPGARRGVPRSSPRRAPATDETMTACAQAMSQQSCADFLTAPPAVCATPGALANGAACEFPTQCASSFCQSTTTVCGKCAPRAAARRRVHPHQRSPVRGVPVGADCAPSPTSAGTCTVPIALGGTCDINVENACTPPLTCLQGLCAPRVAVDAGPCEYEEDCAGSAGCFGSVCRDVAIQPIGAASGYLDRPGLRPRRRVREPRRPVRQRELRRPVDDRRTLHDVRGLREPRRVRRRRLRGRGACSVLSVTVRRAPPRHRPPGSARS